MARERLEVDTGAVRSLADNLYIVHNALSDAQSTSDGLADMVGHSGLADTIDDFSSKWDDRRKELVDQIEHLKGVAASVADSFDEVDNELAKALTEEPSNVTPAGVV